MPDFDERLDAALLAFSKNPKEAVTACELLGDRPEGAALKVLNCLREGDLAGARAIPLGADAAGQAAKALLAFHSGDIERALSGIEELLAWAPNDPIVQIAAIRLLPLEDADRALDVARRYANARPHDPGATWMLLGPLQAAGEEGALQRIADDPPAAFARTTGYLMLRANLALERGSLAEAEEITRQAVAQSPDNAGAWTLLARILRNQDRREESEQAALFALQINPRESAAVWNLALLARRRGDEAEAKRLEAKAKALNPADEMMRPLEEVRRLFRAGRHYEMLDALNRLDRLPPFARRAGEKLKLSVLARVGGTDELRQALEEATRSDVTTTFARAELWMREGRYAEARSLLEPLWADQRPSAIAQFLLKARLHESREDAKALMRDLVAEPPGSLMGCLGVVLSLIESKMERESLDFLAAARRRYPQSRTLLRHQIRADMAYFRIVKAWSACEELDPKDRRNLRKDILVFSLRKLVKLRWRRLLAHSNRKP